MFDFTALIDALEDKMARANTHAHAERYSEDAELYKAWASQARLAWEVTSYLSDRHYNVECHPYADCDHEAVTLYAFLRRLPFALSREAFWQNCTQADAEATLELVLEAVGRRVDAQLSGAVQYEV